MNAPPPNPYAPPATQGPFAVAAPARGPMPTSVKVAVIATGVTVAFSFLSGVISLVNGAGSIGSLATNLVIGGLILAGMVRGHRLAWQWGRITGVLSLIVLSIALASLLSQVARLNAAELLGLVITSVMAVCVLAAVIALSLPSAFGHFRLVCPQCARRTTAAGDFLFEKAKCKRCNITF